MRIHVPGCHLPQHRNKFADALRKRGHILVDWDKKDLPDAVVILDTDLGSGKSIDRWIHRVLIPAGVPYVIIQRGADGASSAQLKRLKTLRHADAVIDYDNIFSAHLGAVRSHRYQLRADYRPIWDCIEELA